MKPWTTRDRVTLAVFGALWGVAEMTVGAMLHAIKLPLTGLVMCSFGMLIALTGYQFVPRRGAVLTIGVVSALLKLFSVGANVLNPMLAIAIESLLAELALLPDRGRPHVATLALAGALAGTWSFCHPFVGQGLLLGQGVVKIWSRTLASGAKLLHLDPGAVVAILVALVAIHVVGGACAGVLARGLGRQLTHRVRAGQGEA